MTLLDGLNDQQRQAVLHDEGPCCVLAGAGSGKTRVLTHRIARLLEAGVRPESLWACTFTRKAAAEMQERLAGLVGGVAEAVNMGTIHSFCFRILREEWEEQGRPYQVLDEGGQKRIMRQVLGPKGLNISEDLLTVPGALAAISRMKNDLLTPSKAEALAETHPVIIPVYYEYERLKAADGLIDFDDMLLLCHQELAENPAILRKWRGRWTWVLVDEFQDTNAAQWEIIRLLAAPEDNLFVVGDDWQAIYGWRSARPEFIVNFQSYYPNAKVIPLEINYRSVEPIVQAGNTLIRHNSGQAEKTLRAHRGTGGDPVLIEAADEAEEASVIVHEIKSLLAEGAGPGQIAILYRTNRQSRALEDALVRDGSIPYVLAAGVGFYGRREVKDMLAYLRLTVDRDDDEAWERIVNKPNRFLGTAYVRDVRDAARQAGRSLYEAMLLPPLKAFQERGAMDLRAVIEALRREDMPPARMIAEVRRLTGYDDWLRRERADEADDVATELLDELQAAASRFGSVPDFLRFAAEMESRAKSRDKTQGDRVVLSTIHRAKGLEWPYVFVAGCAEDLLPHRNAESIDEERRLCYVAITRARDQVYLCFPGSYGGKGLSPSRFLVEVGLYDSILSAVASDA